MNLKLFYEKQETLEQFVRHNAKMTEEVFSSIPMVDKRVFAFKVEFGELANETAWFKYWKKSHKVDRDKVLEELADCIHFLVAIGIYRKYREFIQRLDWQRHMTEETDELYRKVMESPIDSSAKWMRTFARLIAIGVKLGFTLEEIELGYLAKNQKNIERQLLNY
jgi:dimeric dUTPase (all-alpha-NTP-PPase superfamily)